MFNELKKEIENCKYCEEKFGFEPRPIFWGKENSKIAQISQAPSNAVHNSGKPFTDMSGKTLKYEWYQISDEDFYDIDNFFIGAIAHCYPGKDKSGNDRQPPKCCFNKWVQRELKLLNNEIYIIIGAKAAKIFFPNENFEDLVFKNNYWNNKLTIVLPHPSPLNKKWIKDHPKFLEERIFEIREIINTTIKMGNIGEIATRDIARRTLGLKENLTVAKRDGGVAQGARDLYEREIKKSAISKDNALNYQYVNEQQKIGSKGNYDLCKIFK